MLPFAAALAQEAVKLRRCTTTAIYWSAVRMRTDIIGVSSCRANSRKRRLVVHRASDGKKMWAKDADYMNRPAIVNQMVIAEPWAFELSTGEERKATKPADGH